MREWRPLAMKTTTNQRREHVGYKYVAVFTRLAVVASQISEIPQNSMKIRIYSSSRSLILVSIESAYATSY